MENELELQETQETPDEVSQEPQADSLEDLDYDSAIERLKSEEKARKEYEAKMKHWRDKAQKLEERIPKDEAPVINPDEAVEQRLSSLELERQKHSFGYKNNLSPEEVDHIFRVNPKNPEEALNDPFIKGGIDAVRKQKRVNEATPSSSRSANVIGGKSWGEMSEDEQRKNYDKILARGKR